VDIENVVVVHCKAGMARTGLMISSLLLYLKVNLSNVYHVPIHCLGYINWKNSIYAPAIYLLYSNKNLQNSKCPKNLQKIILLLRHIQRTSSKEMTGIWDASLVFQAHEIFSLFVRVFLI
jgi:protein tyrosine/serine phosphatase